MRNAWLVAATGALCGACAAPGVGGFGDISRPPWAEQAPAWSDYRDVYPRAAAARRVAGVVMLDCEILRDRTLGCAIESEAPGDLGFGQAALELSRRFVVKPADEDARLAIGRTVRLPVRFVPG